MKLTRSIVLLIFWCLPFIATESHASSEKLPAELGSYRIITVAISERIPFVVLGRNETPKGLDVQILENFAKKFHLRINYVILNSSLNYVFSNEQQFRAFSNQVNLSKIDLFAGALGGTVLTNKNFIASQTYYHDTLTWCVQKKQAIPKWRNIFHLCRDSRVWILFPMMCIAVIFTAYFIQQFEDVQPKWDWFRITAAAFSCICGYGSSYKPQLFSNRIFYICSLFASIIFGVTFIAFLINLLTAPIYMHQISSIKDFMDGSYNLVGDRFALQFLGRQNNTYSAKLLDSFKVCADLDECLSNLNRNSKLAVAISREHSSNSISTFHSYCFESPEIIYEYSLKFLMRKNFLYAEELNEFIRMASAGGLIYKWHKDNQIRKNNEKSRIYFRYRLENYYGALLIWLSTLFIAICILFIEIFVHKKRSEPNPSQIWIAVEMFIDPVRHFWLEDKLV